MPMGLEIGKYGLFDRPVYAAPQWQPGSAYWSLYSSVVFYFVAEIILQFHEKNEVPVWLGWLCLLVGFVSTFHHMRYETQQLYDALLTVVTTTQ